MLLFSANISWDQPGKQIQNALAFIVKNFRIYPLQLDISGNPSWLIFNGDNKCLSQIIKILNELPNRDTFSNYKDKDGNSWLKAGPYYYLLNSENQWEEFPIDLDITKLIHTGNVNYAN